MQIKLHDVNKDKNAVKEKNIGKADIEWWLHFLELWKRFFFFIYPFFSLIFPEYSAALQFTLKD